LTQYVRNVLFFAAVMLVITPTLGMLVPDAPSFVRTNLFALNAVMALCTLAFVWLHPGDGKSGRAQPLRFTRAA
jgi:hypothetical protein